jgi:anti-sigma regulatory factor (Ser/Thr protein kinase)
VAAVLAGAGCRDIDAVLVVVSELITNAIVHTRSGSNGGRVRVEIEEAGDDLVGVEVTDQGAATVPAQRTPDCEGGRGLWLVGDLALHWGVRQLNAGRSVVWALMDVSPAEQGARAVTDGGREGSDGHAPALPSHLS